jgi:hypothetical protein
MKNSLNIPLALLLLTILPVSIARAQFSIDWYTIDSGGGISSGGSFEVAGTIGQPDAGSHSGGAFQVDGGFWPVAVASEGCPADLDGNGLLDLFDFLAFTNLFNAGDPDADFDASGVLDLFDFLAFTNAFNGGC